VDVRDNGGGHIHAAEFAPNVNSPGTFVAEFVRLIRQLPQDNVKMRMCNLARTQGRQRFVCLGGPLLGDQLGANSSTLARWVSSPSRSKPWNTAVSRSAETNEGRFSTICQLYRSSGVVPARSM
jgi:hypothetical protein